MSNAQQIELKKSAGDYEKEDDRRIAAYVRNRELRELEYAHQQEGIKAAKERETLRLRAMQEKMADKQVRTFASTHTHLHPPPSVSSVSSVLRPPSSVLHPPSCHLHPPPSTLHHPPLLPTLPSTLHPNLPSPPLHPPLTPPPLPPPQAELDGLRSKRAIEEAERQWRRKEAASAERQLSINLTLNEARSSSSSSS